MGGGPDEGGGAVPGDPDLAGNLGPGGGGGHKGGEGQEGLQGRLFTDDSEVWEGLATAWSVFWQRALGCGLNNSHKWILT